MPSLNDKFIRSIPTPDNKHKIYWDDRVVGLGIRITSNNALSFILDYVISGRRRRYTIGRYPALTTTAAREIATELKGKIVRGYDPLEEKKAIYSTPTIKEFSVDFLKAKEKVLRPTTLESYRIFALEKYILPKFGSLRIDSISKRDVQAFHSSLSKIPKMANRLLRILSSLFGVAVSWDLVSSNPASGIKKFPEHKRERYLSDDEIKNLSEILNEERDQMNINAIRLILLTGSRKSEVLSARWQDFNLEKGIWLKPAMLTKQNKNHYTPLNGEALDIVKKMKQKIISDSKIESSERTVSTKEYLFFNPKTKTHLRDIKKFWAKICKKAGIKNARIHDLRHTFASILVSKGVSLEVIGKLIGHSSITTTQRYSHLANSSLKQATDMLASEIMKKD